MYTAYTEIFLQKDVDMLLHNKFIVVIGDSIQRGTYKDLVLLLQKNKYLTEADLKKKGEFSFNGDQLIEGGQKGEMHNGKSYREIRQYQTDHNLLRFYFVTRCYNTYMESILADLCKEPRPDVIIMNSCLWDITRYGKNSVEMYKENLEKLFNRFSNCLTEDCLVLWNATLPISKDARGGFIVPEIEFMNSTLRLDILEANFYAHQIATSHGYDFLDLHYYLRHQLHRRVCDGIHWDMTAHRRITNLILCHLSNAWKGHAKVHEFKVAAAERFNSLVMDKLTRHPPVAAVYPINFGLSKTLMDQQNKIHVPDNDLLLDFQWKPYANHEFRHSKKSRQRFRDHTY